MESSHVLIYLGACPRQNVSQAKGPKIDFETCAGICIVKFVLSACLAAKYKHPSYSNTIVCCSLVDEQGLDSLEVSIAGTFPS